MAYRNTSKGERPDLAKTDPRAGAVLGKMTGEVEDTEETSFVDQANVARIRRKHTRIRAGAGRQSQPGGGINVYQDQDPSARERGTADGTQETGRERRREETKEPQKASRIKPQ